MRAFNSRVELLAGDGTTHLRWLPDALARAMVTAGTAAISTVNGKVRSIVLTMPASGFAQRIGPPEGRATGVRFTRLHLEESGTRTWEHHPGRPTTAREGSLLCVTESVPKLSP